MVATVIAVSYVLAAPGRDLDLDKAVHGLASSTRLSPGDKSILRNAVGGARVVFLGELTHGDGTSFEVKTELVKFFHDEMGFDALIWESGLYDCAEMDAELGGKKPLDDVARSGVFGHWSTAVQSFPVFEYARQTRKSERPLRMAGFDLQNSGTAGYSMFPDILGWFDGSPALTAEDRKAVQDAFEAARSAGQAADPQKAMADAVAAVNATAPRFLRAYEREKKTLDKAWGDRAPFRAQVLKSTERAAEMLRLNSEAAEKGTGISGPYNLREAQNAANLAWLLDNPLKGKKVVVWAHNAHVFRGLPGVGSGVGRSPRPGDLDSMGRLFARDRKDRTYVIGFLAYQGSWSWLGNPEITFETAKDGTLEAALHRQGHALSFVDLKGLPPKHALRKPLPAVIDRQNPFTLETVWPDGFDGVVFIDAMKPRVQRKPAG
ncbi:MAG: erythromycin esterase family protein [Armatimonadetes bacterium]|nr:erythromycin esterase family protein [Armatimonadota bacterium]